MDYVKEIVYSYNLMSLPIPLTYMYTWAHWIMHPSAHTHARKSALAQAVPVSNAADFPGSFAQRFMKKGCLLQPELSQRDLHQS